MKRRKGEEKYKRDMAEQGNTKQRLREREANEGEEEVWNNQKYLIISYRYQSGEEKEN